jgi:hypothetical protein
MPNVEFRAGLLESNSVVDVLQARVSEISLTVKGELSDVFDGTEYIVAVVIQRPYIRRVYVP